MITKRLRLKIRAQHLRNRRLQKIQAKKRISRLRTRSNPKARLQTHKQSTKTIIRLNKKKLKIKAALTLIPTTYLLNRHKVKNKTSKYQGNLQIQNRKMKNKTRKIHKVYKKQIMKRKLKKSKIMNSVSSIFLPRAKNQRIQKTSSRHLAKIQKLCSSMALISMIAKRQSCVSWVPIYKASISRWKLLSWTTRLCAPKQRTGISAPVTPMGLM